MRLALCSAAAPHLAVEALDAACRERGLDGEEIVVGSLDADLSAARMRSANLRVVALRAEGLELNSTAALARASALLGVPVSVPRQALPLDHLRSVASVFARVGGRLLLSHGTSLDEVLALTGSIASAGATASLGLAWEIRPSTESLDEASAVAFAAGEQLGVVRLYGGGPEQREQDGLGLGTLFVDLALTGCEAPLVLCPSDEGKLPRWSKWLMSQRSAGCGSQKDARTLQLDVRDVEPRDRLDTILGAYRSLTPGKTLELTVDHDPSCMYFMLVATEPAGSFRFHKIEHGPEVWRAEVTKQ